LLAHLTYFVFAATVLTPKLLDLDELTATASLAAATNVVEMLVQLIENVIEEKQIS